MFDPKDKSFDKDSLQTPDYLYQYLNSLYQFDIDLAASDDHHHCDNYLTKQDDALIVPWSLYGKTGFCNPPYSKIPPWIKKALEEAAKGFTTVFLIPSFNGDAYYEDLLVYSDYITQIIGRVSFIRPDNGLEYKGNNRGSSVFVITPESVINLEPSYTYMTRDDLIKRYNDLRRPELNIISKS